MENGEPFDSRCDGCPVGDPEQCQELDDLERQAILFCNRVHHPAHAGYAGLVAQVAWPDLPPSEVQPFLDLVQVVWSTRAEIDAEAAKKRPPLEE